MLWILKKTLLCIWGDRVIFEKMDPVNFSQKSAIKRVYVFNHHSWKDVFIILSGFLKYQIELPKIVTSAHLNWFPLSYLLPLFGSHFLLPKKFWFSNIKRSDDFFKSLTSDDQDILLFIDGRRSDIEYFDDEKCWGIKKIFEHHHRTSRKPIIAFPACIEILKGDPFHFSRKRSSLPQCQNHRIIFGSPKALSQTMSQRRLKGYHQYANRLKKSIQSLHHWSARTQILFVIFLMKQDPTLKEEFNSSYFFSTMHVVALIKTYLQSQTDLISFEESCNAAKQLFYTVSTHALHEAAYESLPYLSELALFLKQQQMSVKTSPETQLSFNIWLNFYAHYLYQRPAKPLLKRLKSSELRVLNHPQIMDSILNLFAPIWNFSIALMQLDCRCSNNKLLDEKNKFYYPIFDCLTRRCEKKNFKKQFFLNHVSFLK